MKMNCHLEGVCHAASAHQFTFVWQVYQSSHHAQFTELGADLAKSRSQLRLSMVAKDQNVLVNQHHHHHHHQVHKIVQDRLQHAQKDKNVF